jgi:hypothetical protein
LPDDTTVVGLITNNDETAYREEVRNVSVWCQDNIYLNMSKTKELIVDYRKKGGLARSQGYSGAGRELQVPWRPHH